MWLPVLSDENQEDKTEIVSVHLADARHLQLNYRLENSCSEKYCTCCANKGNCPHRTSQGMEIFWISKQKRPAQVRVLALAAQIVQQNNPYNFTF